jgi:hypothetical protein
MKKEYLDNIYIVIISIVNIYLIGYLFFGNISTGKGLSSFNALNIIGGSNFIISNLVFYITYIIFHIFLIIAICVHTKSKD